MVGISVTVAKTLSAGQCMLPECHDQSQPGTATVHLDFIIGQLSLQYRAPVSGLADVNSYARPFCL